MSEPKLTVLMTVRNGQPYLQEAVGSILNQTYKDFRFLILDNASTDESREIIRAFHDPRIDLVELPQDIGQTAALNRGLQMVDTPWVARMDADDVSLPQRLELQMRYLASHPEVVLLGTGVCLIDGGGQIIRNRRVLVEDIDLRWQLIMGKAAFDHSSAVFASDAAVRAGGYPLQYRYAQDYGFWFRLLDFGQIANISQQLVYGRVHSSNTTNFGQAEQEIQCILQMQLCKLFPQETDITLARVAKAVRGVGSDSYLVPPDAVIRCLSALPARFRAVSGCSPSRSLLRDYSYHWLYMARRASLVSWRKAFAWMRLVLQLEPTFWAHARFWYTLGTVLVAPVRRYKV